MRRPTLLSLLALLIAFTVGCLASCAQASDGWGRTAAEQQLLPDEGLLVPSAAASSERSARLEANLLPLLAAALWPLAMRRCGVALPLRDSRLPRQTDFRGLLPLPAAPPSAA